MPFIDTLRHALEQLRATAKASIPSHKVGEEEMTVDPALKGVEHEVREELEGQVGGRNVWEALRAQVCGRGTYVSVRRGCYVYGGALLFQHAPLLTTCLIPFFPPSLPLSILPPTYHSSRSPWTS
jgi:hypothetical protein